MDNLKLANASTVHSDTYSPKSIRAQDEDAEPKIPLLKPLPTASMLLWKSVRHLYPTVSSRYLEYDLSTAFSAAASPLSAAYQAVQPPSEPGQVFLHIRNYLDLVYPLYPVICEQAIYVIVTAVVKDGIKESISSALVLLMTVLGRLYSRYEGIENIVGDLDRATRIMSWLPLEHSLEHAQAHTLCALAFAKLSMLSTSFYLDRSCLILYEFLRRYVPSY